MAPPTLIASSSFNKNIGEFAHDGDTRLLRYGYLFTADSLYKLSQLELIAPEDEIHTYITIERVGAVADDYQRITETIVDLADLDASDEDVYWHLLNAGYLDETKNVAVGRIALRTYHFLDDAGCPVEAPQVAGVKVERAFQQRGITSRSYMFLLNWYEHLVCDEEQTINGAKIWANSLYDLCNVRIYNGKGQVFEDRLSELGVGAKGFLPWNKGMHVDLSGWHPNEIQLTVQKFIVLIISRNTTPLVGFCPS